MIGWGVVATGGIADVVTADMRLVPGVEVRAVSSRNLERAAAFAAKHEIPGAYGDYRELLADPTVDVVYVATPNTQHHEVTRAALLAGKAVLCEKPFTVTNEEAEELVALARHRGLFLMEAMWTRFNPLVRKLRELVADGVIGQVRSVRASFGAVFPFDPAHRVWDPAAGGGSLLDVGVYPISFAHMLLGEPESLAAHGSLRNGVDADAALLLRYPDGVSAQVTSSLIAPLPIAALVTGTEGSIELPPEFFAAREMIVTRAGAGPEQHTIELTGHGYTYQIAEVTERITAGDTESPHMRLDETLAVQRTMVTALAGLVL